MAWEEETGIWMEVQRQIVAGNSSLETAYKVLQTVMQIFCIKLFLNKTGRQFETDYS